MRRCRSVNSTRLPALTIPTPHTLSCPLPAALVCQRSTSLSPAGSCSPSPASPLPRSSACTPRPGLVQRKEAALQVPGLCTHGPCRPLLASSAPPLSQHKCCSHSLAWSPTTWATSAGRGCYHSSWHPQKPGQVHNRRSVSVALPGRGSNWSYLLWLTF